MSCNCVSTYLSAHRRPYCCLFLLFCRLLITTLLQLHQNEVCWCFLKNIKILLFPWSCTLNENFYGALITYTNTMSGETCCQPVKLQVFLINNIMWTNGWVIMIWHMQTGIHKRWKSFRWCVSAFPISAFSA